MSETFITKMPRWLDLALRFKIATLREDALTILLRWGSVIRDAEVIARARQLEAANKNELAFAEYLWTEKALESLTPAQLTALQKRVKR
jgi:hypothetical protein